MNFAGNFVTIGRVDVADLGARIAQLSLESWHEDDYRQKRYEVHRDTQTIALVFDPDFRHTHPTRLPRLQQFESALRPMLAAIADYYEESNKGRQLIEQFGLGYFIRANFVNLVAGGSIPEHTDNNFSLVHSHRVHIPIITNEKVLFAVGGEVKNIPAGEICEINNRRTHHVINEGRDDRVHLILDFVIPGEKCCCGQRRHLDTPCSPQACIDTDQLKIPCTCYPSA